MNKITVSVLIIAVVAVGGYFAWHSSGGDTQTEQSSTEQTEPTSKKMAFSEFVKQGGSYKCEVKQAMSDFENNGMVYISGNGNTMKMRGEFSTIAEGRTMDTMFIMRDGYSYTWSSMMPGTGFKMKVATNTTSNTGASSSGTYSWNADQIGDYNCEAWSADEAQFTIPTTITFKAVGGE